MEDALADAGYEPLQACNGLEALEVLEAKHVDLIVLDIMMPKMDGYELLKQIRQAGMDMPVLLVTAKQALPDKKKGFLLGADDYMVKPFEEEEMLLRIAALLRRAKILTERKLTVGNTELIYDSLTVYQQRGNDGACLDEPHQQCHQIQPQGRAYFYFLPPENRQHCHNHSG